MVSHHIEDESCQTAVVVDGVLLTRSSFWSFDVVQ